MNTLNLSDIKAVAFDIDGTLYPTWKFNLKITFHFLRYCIFFAQYGLVRKNMRIKNEFSDDFTTTQGAHMAKYMKCSTDKAIAKLDKVVYTGLEKKFKNIKPFKGAVEFIRKLKEHGYKIAVLSDFPPEQKGEIWGIRSLCDVLVGAEETGALKPSEIPFKTLAERLELKPEQILYVGNNHKYDVQGSKNVGMKAAWIVPASAKWFKKKSDVADIVFWNYSQLDKIFFENSSNGSEIISN